MIDPSYKSLLDDCWSDLHDAKSLSPDAKAYLGTQLRMVRTAANGDPDKIQALCNLMVVSTVDRIYDRIHGPDLRSKAAEAVVAKCEARHAMVTPQVAGSVQTVAQWAQAIRPVAWPVAFAVSVGLLSPHASQFVDAIARLM